MLSVNRFYSLVIFAFSLSGLTLASQDLQNPYKFQLERIEIFKKNMPAYMKRYYFPRKRFIDRQPISQDYAFNQMELILKGSYLRKLNKKNIKEIKKLERFLYTADDFQLARYFEQERYYLSIPAKQSIKEIQFLAKQDENWRKKSDPEFFTYLTTKASLEERKYYKRYKYKFFSDKSGKELIEILKFESALSLMD